MEPIELPCNEAELPNDIASLKRLVMVLGVRTSRYELRNMVLKRQGQEQVKKSDCVNVFFWRIKDFIIETFTQLFFCFMLD